MCGDGACADGGRETPCSCPSDCGDCLGCCNGDVCEPGTDSNACGENGELCAVCTNGQTCQGKACAYKCGDGVCAEIVGEDCVSCDADCGSCCGNGTCDNGELCQTCPSDCDCFLTSGFVKISKGGFWMGSPDGDCPQAYPLQPCVAEPGRDNSFFYGEKLHYVELTLDFEMKTTEVTVGEWKTAFGGWEPSGMNPAICGNNCPAWHLSWYDTLAYANWKSEQTSLPPCYEFSNAKCVDGTEVGGDYMSCLNDIGGGIDSADVSLLVDGTTKPYGCQGYRLPTEAEWEYAARSSTLSAFHDGLGIDDDHLTCMVPFHLTNIAWYCGNKDYQNLPKPVASKLPNAWGLFDVSGSVYEWCWDGVQGYPQGTTPANPATDPVGAGSAKVVRGGAWNSHASKCRSAGRLGSNPEERATFGFRLVRTQ